MRSRDVLVRHALRVCVCEGSRDRVRERGVQTKSQSICRHPHHASCQSFPVSASHSQSLTARSAVTLAPCQARIGERHPHMHRHREWQGEETLTQDVYITSVQSRTHTHSLLGPSPLLTPRARDERQMRVSLSLAHPPSRVRALVRSSSSLAVVAYSAEQSRESRSR